MLEVLQVLCRAIRKRGDFDVFEQHKVYKEIIMKLTEKGNSINPGWIFIQN